jgi:hypothetical protein
LVNMVDDQHRADNCDNKMDSNTCYCMRTANDKRDLSNSELILHLVHDHQYQLMLTVV